MVKYDFFCQKLIKIHQKLKFLNVSLLNVENRAFPVKNVPFIIEFLAQNCIIFTQILGIKNEIFGQNLVKNEFFCLFSSKMYHF